MAARPERPLVLIVRDGWGVREERRGNAILAARTPRLDGFLAEYPSCLIDASEHHVGLPDGQMGNSEVGHLNIGAGRVVYQELTRISKSIADGDFFQNEALTGAVDRALERNRAIHLLGLLSDGGVHSHQEHLEALLRLIKGRGMQDRVFIHVILDGRDTSPTGGLQYLKRLQASCAALGVGRIATVIGRFYTMDRDNRWERVQQGFDLLYHGVGAKTSEARLLDAISASYARGVTDEFLEPIALVDAQAATFGTLRRGDQVIVFNFRGDRARQICGALTQESFPELNRGEGFPVEVTAFTEYQKGLPFRGVAFPPSVVRNHITSYLADQTYKTAKLAETEKYAHVTFFFNGGVEAPCPGEERFLVPSPKVRTYDLQPEMSAYALTELAVKRIREHGDAFVVINYANTDMVGHTGIFDAVVRAVEVVDECVGKVLDAMLAKGGAGFITADHGNAEQMIDPVTGEVHTAHTLFPVHGILVSKDHRGRRLSPGGALSNIAPTILEVMGLTKPPEMMKPSLLKG